MNIIKKERGFTIVEVLISVVLSGILISGGFNFYTTMQDQTTVQMELSNIQNTARSSIDDIITTLRQAGYKLDGHVPYEINDNSLSIYFNIHNAIDTVTYFLSSSSTGTSVVTNDGDDEGETAQEATMYLMKNCSYGDCSVYADNVVSLNFQKIQDNILEVSIITQAEYPDEAFDLNNGYRQWTLSEVVCLRNI